MARTPGRQLRALRIGVAGRVLRWLVAATLHLTLPSSCSHQCTARIRPLWPDDCHSHLRRGAYVIMALMLEAAALSLTLKVALLALQVPLLALKLAFLPFDIKELLKIVEIGHGAQ